MDDKRIIVADSQRLDSICSCARQYKNRFGTPSNPVGYSPLVKPDYLESGGLQHAMLDTYYNLRRHRSRWHLNGKTHRDIVQACVNVGRHAGVTMSLQLPDVEIGIETFQQYAEFWENDGWDNILAVEEVGSKILYENDEVVILYEVKIDLILKLSNCILPVDHKTTKSHRDPNDLANQFKGYCWFLDVNNIMVNEIGFQRSYEPVKKFHRHLLSYPQDLIDEWVEQAVYWIMYADQCEQEDFFPPNYTSCDKFSGCDYRDICRAERATRDYKMKSRFVEKTWDVGQLL